MEAPQSWKKQTYVKTDLIKTLNPIVAQCLKIIATNTSMVLR